MWPTRDSTDRLLDDAKTGDPAAVDRLLGEFREPLRHVIDLRLDPAVARRVDASDIVQDVLIEANQRLTEYLKRPDMPFHLWLRHLAQDRIIDTHRRHRLAQRRSVDREQPLARPAWAEESSASLVAQLIDTERTPTSEAIAHEPIGSGCRGNGRRHCSSGEFQLLTAPEVMPEMMYFWPTR